MLIVDLMLTSYYLTEFSVVSVAVGKRFPPVKVFSGFLLRLAVFVVVVDVVLHHVCYVPVLSFASLRSLMQVRSSTFVTIEHLIALLSLTGATQAKMGLVIGK